MANDKANNVSQPVSRSIALGVAIAAGIVAAVLRVVPHPPNFSGVGGLGIFGGARLRAWQAYLLPLAIMVLSDLMLWVCTFFNPLYSLGHWSRLYVYGSFLIYVAIGRWLGNRTSIGSVTLAATLGGVQFFFVTNFCDWLFQPLQPGYDLIPAPWKYSRDLDGLITCFGWALGFYQQEVMTPKPFMAVTYFPTAYLVWPIVGDVLFTSIYILVYAKVMRRVGADEPAPLTTPIAEVQA